MLFLERIAEEKIQAAIRRGELDQLPGKGKPIPEETGLDLVAPDLRLAYRILKNAGYVPEEVRVRCEIGELTGLLRGCHAPAEDQGKARARLHLLMQRLGELRGESLWIEEEYCQRIAEKLSGEPHET